LSLGRQGDQVAAEENGIRGGGAVSLRTTSPISVSVDNQLSRGGAEKDQVGVDRATDVAEEALQRSKMGLPWFMHMKANLLNSIGEVRPGESEVLWGSNKTPVGSRIRHGITQGSRQLRPIGVKQGLQSLLAPEYQEHTVAVNSCCREEIMR
jgi:hypothetical protein